MLPFLLAVCSQGEEAEGASTEKAEGSESGKDDSYSSGWRTICNSMDCRLESA